MRTFGDSDRFRRPTSSRQARRSLSIRQTLVRNSTGLAKNCGKSSTRMMCGWPGCNRSLERFVSKQYTAVGIRDDDGLIRQADLPADVFELILCNQHSDRTELQGDSATDSPIRRAAVRSAGVHGSDVPSTI